MAAEAAIAQAGPTPDATEPTSAEPASLPSSIVTVPGAAAPARARFDGLPGSPAYAPLLPEDTPPDLAQSDPAQPLANLGQALERAYWTNPQLLAERARLRSVDFRLPQARAQYGPQVRYSASYGYQQNGYEQPGGITIRRDGWASTASAILAQPLFAFGGLRAGEDAALAQIAFQRAALRSAEQETLLQAIAAYASVLRDRTGLDIASENADLLTQQLSNTRIRLELGESTATDFQQIQARLELARAELLAAQGQGISSDAVFLQVIGAPAGELAPPDELMLPVRTLEDAYAYAQGSNPVLASAYARERLSRAEVRSARADLLPRVELQGSINRGTSSVVGPELAQTELRGAITLSGTVDSGARQARIDELKAANDADWRLIDNALRQSRAELADAWNQWQTQTAAIARLEVAARAAEQAVDGALIQERAGLRTTLEILETARDLLQVRTNLNAATANAYVAKARVLAALGLLDHEHLLPQAEHYDEQRHFDRVDSSADLPPFTQAARALDSLITPLPVDRPIRDPAGPLGRSGQTLDAQADGP